LTASVARNTAEGNYAFTVKSLVQSHQLVSSGYASADSTIEAGAITIEMGNGNVDRDTTLDMLNGGGGVAAGSISISDRSGRNVTLDLSGATTINDVLDTINGSLDISVTASVEDEHIVLTDTSGSTSYNLVVSEVSGCSTAADLGIVANVASSTITGESISYLSGSMYLDSLNDGRGVRHNYALDDFRIRRRDEATLDIDISGAETLQDVIDLINNNEDNADGLLTASISADGQGIELTDSTGGFEDLLVTALNGSSSAADLGILKSSSSDTITGDRIISKLGTVLLASLAGGSGVPEGSIDITDRSGASSVVDLTGAETLSDVMDAINAAGVAVTASLNEAGTALVLTDTSGGSGTLSVAEVDSTAAEALGILGSADANTLRGENLQFQYISERTLLDDLNTGSGVFAGSFRITDRSGQSATVDLSQADDTRIEDVISEINSRGLGITASINSTGDGILLTDTTGDTGTLTIADLNGGTTAADLNIAGTADDDDPTHIDGSFEYTIVVEEGDTLEEVATKIENSGAPVSASLINDGSATSPYRLGLVSTVSGSVGKMVIDSGETGLDLVTTQQARDAVVLYGESLPGSSPLVLTSTTNTITGIVEGLTINLVGTSTSPVYVSVSADDSYITNTVSEFVDNWNTAMDFIQEATVFDADSSEMGLLLGDPLLQRIEDIMNRMISYSMTGAEPTLNRLSRLGVSFLETGNISFESTDLINALAEDRQAVEDLFTTEDTGLGAYFVETLERITDEYDGLTANKDDLYEDQIEVLQTQVNDLEDRVSATQTRLYSQFYAMETAISALQSQQTIIDNLPNYFDNNSDS
jgi:flagellar hook-associated protein 2